MRQGPAENKHPQPMTDTRRLLYRLGHIDIRLVGPVSIYCSTIGRLAVANIHVITLMSEKAISFPCIAVGQT